MTCRTTTPPTGPNGNNARARTLTSPEALSRPGKSAPSVANLQSAINALYSAAAEAETSAEYTSSIMRDCMSHGQRLDLLRATLALVLKNAGADTVWEAVEHIFVPLLIGLSEGQQEIGNIVGTGMVGSDGRDHLRELTKKEGDPLKRGIDAMARHCPEVLYGHSESDND